MCAPYLNYNTSVKVGQWLKIPIMLFNWLNNVNGAQWTVACCSPPRPCEQKIEENLKMFMSVPPNLVYVNMIYYVHYTHKLKQNNCTVFVLRSCNTHGAIFTFTYEEYILLTRAFVCWVFAEKSTAAIHEYDNCKYFSILKRLGWPQLTLIFISVGSVPSLTVPWGVSYAIGI